MWKNLNFSSKVTVLVAVLILFTILTGVGHHKMSNEIKEIGIQSAGDEMLAGYKSELKDIVVVMAKTLASATEGMTDESDIVSMYHKLANDVRFFPDESGYFFIYKESVNVMLPILPHLVGKDLIDLTDANGGKPVQDMLKVASQGGGFIEYYWDKPGKGIVPKWSYAQNIGDSPFIIGTGVYIDDVEERQAHIHEKMNNFTLDFMLKWSAILVLVFLVFILPLIIFLIKSITSPLKRLTDVASGYSRGALDDEIQFTDRKDEIGALSRAVQRLGKSTKIIMKKLEQAQ